MIVTWIVGVAVVVFAFLLFNLIMLHIYLICKEMTTYELIMLRREEEKQ